MTTGVSTAPPLDLRPASIAPTNGSRTVASNVGTTRRPEHTQIDGLTDRARPRGRGGGRGRGRGRGGLRAGTNAASEPVVGAADLPTEQHEQPPQHSVRVRRARGHGRVFAPGRQSTHNGLQNGHSNQQSSQLHPEAPEFRPGQSHQTRQNNAPGAKPIQAVTKASHHNSQVTKARGRRPSSLKSNAPDIATRTHEDIGNGIYECPICTSEVSTKSRIWSCKTCWTVFHLTCIEKWSTNQGSAMVQQRSDDEELPPPRRWRCPGCNLPKDVLPTNYTCWCEKEMDPRSTPGLPPHSCGQTCGKERVLPKKCPHPCDLLCHAGPCPPCSHMGPVRSCFCGKRMTSRRCVETNYDTGWSCGEVCGDIMPCGEHECPRPCHEGLCGACEVEMDARCYCGKEEQSLACCDRSDGEMSRRKSEDGSLKEWTGLYGCNQTCGRAFDCEKHHCEKLCHVQEEETPFCPRSPRVIDRCPCGKTSLGDLLSTPRQSCEDPIPNCDRQCLKLLGCGHPCQQSCHSGECMPCTLPMEISCCCGRTRSRTVCHQGTDEQPHCMRVCKATLNCGRHECGERCCTGERKAAERHATKRKLRPLGAAQMVDDSFEAEHICTRVCGRALKCGNHTCPELCHKGPCGSCREAIFEDISCNCGRTILQPPLPCGTSSPLCNFQCERPKACDHPKVPHNCHGDSEACPKCPFLEQKACLCGKNTLKNQPCWLTEVRCGDICGRKLKCGSHLCRKQCHRQGECEDTGTRCQQACGKTKKTCGHPCDEQCHAPSSCREDKPCQHRMLVTCDCQRIKQDVKCLASKDSEGNTKKALPCDDECGRLARNQKLAQALNIDPATHQDDHIPYSNETLKLFCENFKWAQIQEKEFRIFAADETEKRLRFKPMQSHQRAFLHSLSEDFGIDSESMDPEPHRHVAVFKTPRFVMAPMKTLAECVRIRNNLNIAAPTSTPATAAITTQKPLKTSNEPYNGFLLSSLRFGLTIDELRHDLNPAFSTLSGLKFDISFLPSEEIAIRARSKTSLPSSSLTSFTPQAIDSALRNLKPALTTLVTSPPNHHASKCQLCALDPHLNILLREIDDSVANTGGWSQVVAKAAAAPRTIRQQPVVGGKSAYTVLGSKVKETSSSSQKTDKKKKTAGVGKDQDEDEDEKEYEKRQEGRTRNGENDGRHDDGGAEGGVIKAMGMDVVVDDWEEDYQKFEDEQQATTAAAAATATATATAIAIPTTTAVDEEKTVVVRSGGDDGKQATDTETTNFPSDEVIDGQ